MAHAARATTMSKKTVTALPAARALAALLGPRSDGGEQGLCLGLFVLEVRKEVKQVLS